MIGFVTLMLICHLDISLSAPDESPSSSQVKAFRKQYVTTYDTVHIRPELTLGLAISPPPLSTLGSHQIPPTMSTVVLITGANRGLGRGLLARYLAQPNHTVIATNWQPRPPDLPDPLRAAHSRRLPAVRRQGRHPGLAGPLRCRRGARPAARHIDVVIANAGVSYVWPLVAGVERDLRAHLEANAYGVVSL